MPSLGQYVRAWLAFTTLQDLGAIWMCYAGQASGISISATASSLRQHALSIMLLAVTRIFLLVFFDSTPLHLCNITISSLFTLHVAADILYYQDTSSILPNIVRIIFHALSIVVLSIYYFIVIARPSNPQQKKGRLLASHYMERHFLAPPDSEEFRKLKKKP